MIFLHSVIAIRQEKNWVIAYEFQNIIPVLYIYIYIFGRVGSSKRSGKTYWMTYWSSWENRFAIDWVGEKFISILEEQALNFWHMKIETLSLSKWKYLIGIWTWNIDAKIEIIQQVGHLPFCSHLGHNFQDLVWCPQSHEEGSPSTEPRVRPEHHVLWLHQYKINLKYR